MAFSIWAWLGRGPAMCEVVWVGVHGGEKSFENWYDMPCPALEPALHAPPVIIYIPVPLGFPFGLACADRMYTPVGGKAPSVRYQEEGQGLPKHAPP